MRKLCRGPLCASENPDSWYTKCRTHHLERPPVATRDAAVFVYGTN